MVVILEGTSGVGKTLTGRLLQDVFGGDLEYARLPGWEGSETCKQIRAILKNGEHLDPHTRLHLYVADMNEFFSKHDKNKVYILDRSWISTLVYQSIDGVPRCHVESLISHLIDQVDACILLTCDPKVAVARLTARETKTLANYKDRDEAFYAKIQRKYIEECNEYFAGEELCVIDTTTLDRYEVVDRASAFIDNLVR